MNRVAALVLLVGGVLLMSWAVAPAAPTLQPRRAAEIDRADPADSRDLTEKMSAEVQKLRERLEATTPYPSPSRDPFRFGSTRRPAAPSVTPQPEMPPVEPPSLPRLVAILTEGEPGRPTWCAVLAIGGDVRMLKAGETIAGFEVRRVTASDAELFDPISSRTFRLTLK